MTKKTFPLRPWSLQVLLLLILIVLILPLNLLYITAARRSASALTSQARYSMEHITSIAVNELQARLYRTDAFVENTVRNNEHLHAMQADRDPVSYSADKFFLVQDLIDSSATGTDGDFYFVYSPRFEDTLIGRASRLSNRISYSSIYSFVRDYLAEGSGPSPWHMVRMDGIPYLLSCRQANGMLIGSMIGLSFVENYLPGNLGYPSASFSFAETPPEPEGAQSDALVVSSAPLRQCKDLFLVTAVDREDILRDLSWLQRNTISLSIAYLVLIPLLMILLTYLLIYPLGVLLHAIAQIDGGSADFRVGAVHAAREYKVVFEAFNRMLDRIKTLRIDNYEKELARQKAEMEKQDVELQNLQLMIRPHFLQNTFGLLYTMSQIGQTEKLGPFILYLSEYFRYVYRSGNEIPFSVELELIEGYLGLAEVQHPDSFSYSLDIPEDIEAVRVPPLLIHNFIENAISHSARQGSFLHIRLQLRIEGDTAVFTVSDDGIGIPEGTLMRINQGLPVEDRERVHVGIHNSYRRLQSLYGGRALLHVDSALFEGTTVTIRIPEEGL